MLKRSTSAKKPTAPFWIAAAVGALFLAVGAGVWTGARTHAANQGQSEADSQRALGLGLRAAREGLDRDALALKEAAIGLPEATTFSKGILLWAELESSAQGVSSIKRTLLNPDWKVQPGELDRLQSSFLPTAVAYLNQPTRWRDIRKGKTELVRVKKDAAGPDEWLALAFGTTQTAPALGADFAGSTVLIVVDPAQAFASVPHWGSKGAARGYRSYVASLDGRVLAHSLERFNGTELGGNPAFQSAIAALARAQAERRSMTAPGIVKRIEGEEGVPIAVAAIRALSVPVYLVVEQSLEAPKGARAEPVGAPPRSMRKSLGIAVLLGLIIGFTMYVLQLLQRNAGAQARALQAELEIRRAESEAYLEQVRAEEQTKVREEMRAASEARRSEEARQNEILGRIRAAEQELVRQFELEVLRQRDPKKIAYSVCQLANRLCRAPALFFTYQPLTKKAFLMTAVGFSSSAQKPSFMFELNDEILKKIQEADLRGDTMSLSGYLPLSSLMQLHFRAASFRSWAFTGETRQDWSGKTHARLLGVLVVLPSPSEEGQALPVGSWLAPSSGGPKGILKAAGRQYEKALPGN